MLAFGTPVGHPMYAPVEGEELLQLAIQLRTAKQRMGYGPRTRTKVGQAVRDARPRWTVRRWTASLLRTFDSTKAREGSADLAAVSRSHRGDMQL